MSSRKRRSNRLTAKQLDAKREDRQAALHQLTILIAFGQEHLEWWQAMYRSISLRVALRMVADGDAEKFEAETENGKIVLFRELKPFAGVQYALPTMPNAASAEALCAYAPGARLAGRDLRRVEHIIAFPFIGDTRAPRVAPRVSVRDLAAARQLFHLPAAA